jgi:hypothetical protein
MDLYFSESGDLKLTPTRDIALTDSDWRDSAQRAYMILQTTPGDFILYPRLGADLSVLYGMPQSKDTGDLGIKIIEEALTRTTTFSASSLSIKAVPTGPQTIRFDVYIVSGAKRNMMISIQQDLGLV